MNECKKHRPDLALLAAGALPETAAASLQTHLRGCPACARESAALRAVGNELTTAARRLPMATPSEGFHRGLAGRLKVGEVPPNTRVDRPAFFWLPALAGAFGLVLLVGWFLATNRPAASRVPQASVGGGSVAPVAAVVSPRPAQAVLTWQVSRQVVGESTEALDVLLAATAEKTTELTPRITAWTRELSLVSE